MRIMRMMTTMMMTSARGEEQTPGATPGRTVREHEVYLDMGERNLGCPNPWPSVRHRFVSLGEVSTLASARPITAPVHA